MPDNPKSHFDRFLKPILASRFLTISALIHLLLVLLFGGRVLFDKYVEPPDFQSAGDSSVAADIPAPPPDTPQTLPPAPTVAAPPPPSAPTASLSALTSLSAAPSSFSMPLPAMAPPSINPTSTAPVQAQNFGSGTGPAIPGQMGGRGNPADTGAQHGEKPAAEQAVLRALQWLQQEQHTDGTWGSSGAEHDAFTGLALLCFLGHGETPLHSPGGFGVVVTNAINALVSEGAATQACYSGGQGFGGNPAAYAHGICTYAICEAYTMTKDARLKPLVQQAIDYIVKGQRPDGGWAYSYSLDPAFGPSDTSVSGWQIQALKAAHLTGIPGMDKEVQPVMKNAIGDLDRVFDPKDGSFGYRVAGGHNGASNTLTGVGVLSKLLWLGRADETVVKGLKNIRSKDLDYNAKDCDLYAWYYDTQACFQAQGGSWDWWNARFQNQLLTNQSADGSWPPNTGSDPGGYCTKADDDGALYRTTLCCLMLEVFYRYLPTDQDSALSGSGVQGL